VPLASTSYSLGPKLHFNADNETFDNAQANRMLTSEYRKAHLLSREVIS